MFQSGLNEIAWNLYPTVKGDCRLTAEKKMWVREQMVQRVLDRWRNDLTIEEIENIMTNKKYSLS